MTTDKSKSLFKMLTEDMEQCTDPVDCLSEAGVTGMGGGMLRRFFPGRTSELDKLLKDFNDGKYESSPRKIGYEAYDKYIAANPATNTPEQARELLRTKTLPPGVTIPEHWGEAEKTQFWRGWSDSLRSAGETGV